MNIKSIIERVIILAREGESSPSRRELEQRIREFLKTFSAAEIYMVTAVMYLGRGDFGTAGLLNTYEHISDTFDRPDLAIEQMLEKVPLGRYLQQGLDELSKNGIDANTLLTSHADSPLASLEDGSGIELRIGPWNCDTCHQLIDVPENGALQWLTRSSGEGMAGRDLRIVHRIPTSPRGGRNGCYPDDNIELARDGSVISDEDLVNVLGPDGLVKLLSLIEDRCFSVAEVAVVVMRLFVPGYEQARPYFERALASGVVEAWAPTGYFYQSQLREIVANISKLEGMK